MKEQATKNQNQKNIKNMNKTILSSLGLILLLGSNFVSAQTTGNVGIGTTTPTQKLDVEGNARVRQMADATALESTYTKVVVADANGNLGVVSRTTPNIPEGTETIFGNPRVETDVMEGDNFYTLQGKPDKLDYYFRYTGLSITLPPGKWTVYCGFLVSVPSPLKSRYDQESNNIITENVWVRALISDNNNNELYYHNHVPTAAVPGSSMLISTNINPGEFYSFANGLWLVENTTNTAKTYYVKASFAPRFFNSDHQPTIEPMSRWAEDYIIALRRR